MGSKLIELNDGTLIEVEVPADQVQQISGGFSDKVDATFDKVKPLLIRACKPIAEVWQEINKDMTIDSAEVQIGLSFEAEGNVYIAKSKAGANLTVKLTLKPKVENK